MSGFRRWWRLVWVVPALGAAVAAGWLIRAWWPDNGSLMTRPAHAPASLEAETGLGPEVPLEAETTVNAGLSARVEETKPIRTGGPATAAVGGAADGQQDVLLDLVTSESRLVTARLVEEVAGLQRELDEQQRRIRKLSEALAEAQAALDVNEARRATAAGASAPPPADVPVEARIVDVNPELGLVVLNQGAQQGVRYGLPLTVLRDRRRVARIRVVDVREHIAGAMVEETVRGDYPQAGDRATLMRAPGS